MGIFSELFNRFFRNRKIDVVKIDSGQDWCDPLSRKLTPEQVYVNIPVFRAVIDYIAKSASQVPVGLFFDEKKEDLEFLYYPNKRQTWNEFIFDAIAKKHIYGYNVIVYRDGELFNLEQEEIYFDDNGYIVTGKYSAVRKVPNPIDSKSWLSILETTQKLATRAMENLDATSNIIKNGGMSGIISANLQNDFASAKLVEQAEEELRKKFGGGKNYGKLAVVGYPVNYSQVALSAQQLGIIDFYKFDLVDVCRVFGVPSILLNDNENSSYNNVTEAKKSFYREVIIPELMDLCDTINRVLKEPLALRYPKHYFWFDSTGVLALQDDMTMLIDNTLKLYDRGILTIDEVKLKLDR